MPNLFRRYLKCSRQRKTCNRVPCPRILVFIVASFILVNVIMFEAINWRNKNGFQPMVDTNNNAGNHDVRSKRNRNDPNAEVQVDVESLLRHHLDVQKVETLRNIVIKLGLSANQTIVPYDVNIDRRQNISRKSTCAIVGSSGILADSGCGHEIDQHEFVIRENLAKTNNFEDDVGGRTDLMTSNKALTQVLDHCLRGSDIDCYAEYRSRLAALGDVYFLIITFHDWQQSDKRRFIKFIRHARNEKLALDIRIPNKPIKHTIKALWSMRNDTSSGLMIFTIATTFCDRISLYGFYPFDVGPAGGRLSYHYYDGGSWKGVHDMQSEYQLYRKLHREGVVRHVIGKCR